MVIFRFLQPLGDHSYSKKNSINLDDITTTFLSHCQMKQNAEEASQGEGLYVKGVQECGRNKSKEVLEKISKSKNRKTTYAFLDNIFDIERGIV